MLFVCVCLATFFYLQLVSTLKEVKRKCPGLNLQEKVSYLF